MATAETMSIISGPGKFELMLALFEGKEVNFTLRYPGISNRPVDHVVRVRMSSIGREDGSNESWLIACQIGFKHLKGYFSTRDRRGWFRED